MRNTIFLTAFLFIAVIAATIYYFKNLDNEHGQSARPLRFLPQNTLLIAAIGNEEKDTAVFKDFEIFDAFLGKETIKLWGDFNSKVLNTEKTRIYTKNSNIFISFHPEKKEIVPLFTVPTSQAIPAGEVTGVLNEISKNYKTKSLDTLGQKIYQIQYGEKDSLLNAIYYNDIIFASPSIPLIVKIIDKHTKHLSDDQIDFFLKNNPRTTPLSVYFPHQQFDSLSSFMQRNNGGTFLNLFQKLQGQSAWSMNFKQDALILTGESQLDQYPENYASLFKNQQKKKQNLPQYFPSNTAIFASFVVSNKSTFQKDLQALFKRRKEKIAEEIDTTNVSEILNKALGDEFALVETTGQNYIGYIDIQDSTIFKTLYGKILEEPKESYGRFLVSNSLYKKYGDVFKEFSKPYFTIVDSVLVVANNSSTLKDYKRDYTENDLLMGTLSYIKLQSLQDQESNINIFAHHKNANNKIVNTLTEPFRANFKDKEEFGFQNFYSWSVQLSGNNGNMTSQIYALYKGKNTLGTNPEWSLKLDNKAITPPYIFDHSDTSQLILLQELDHTIHAIHPSSGKEMWSKVIAGRIKGEIIQLKDRSIVFVTDKNNFYKINTAGDNIKGFPIKLDSKPSASIMVTNIRGNESILIPVQNHILAFDLNSKPLQNWQKTILDGDISTKIIKINNSFSVGTSTGSIYWLNENGQKTSFLKVSQAGLKNLATINNFKIIALDKKGLLTLVNTDNTNKKIIVNIDSSSFFSDFSPITTANKLNLVTLSNNTLHVFDILDTLKTEFKNKFYSLVDDEPQFFRSQSDNNLFTIGVASKNADLIFLFDNKGELVKGFPIEGQPQFYYGKINYNSDIYLLCMRKDRTLYAFRQQK